MTGLSAAIAILAALRERDRTGEAQSIDVGMLDCAVAGMGSMLSAHVNGGLPAAPVGNAAASGAPSSGMFPTSTSPLTLVANTEAQFAALCGVLGRPELANDPRFREPAPRKQNQDALRAIIAACLAGRPAIEWERMLAEVGVPAGAVRSVPELVDDAQISARDLFRRLELPEQGRDAALPTAGFKLNGRRVAPERGPPLLAADNESVLAELGYDAAAAAGPARGRGVVKNATQKSVGRPAHQRHTGSETHARENHCPSAGPRPCGIGRSLPHRRWPRRSASVGYYPGALISMPALVANEQKFFEKNGLTVELVPVASGPAMTAAVASGSVTFVNNSWDNLILAVDKGLPVRAVAGSTVKVPFALIARKGVALPHLARGLSRPSSRIWSARTGGCSPSASPCISWRRRS